jgi:hypothetical protein
MKNKRYISIGGHCSNHLSAYVQNGEVAHNFCAFDRGRGDKYSFGKNALNNWYSKEHQIVRARRIAVMALYFVELSQEQEN